MDRFSEDKEKSPDTAVDEPEQDNVTLSEKTHVESSTLITKPNAGEQHAQKTVDKLFPEPLLEEGTAFTRIKEGNNPTAKYTPHNFYEFTKQFKQLAPAERLNANGWTEDLHKDLVRNTLDCIAAAGAKGQFGTKSEQWQDSRTALEMAGVANKLPEFIKDLNEGLQKPPFDGKLKIEVTHTPPAKPGMIGSQTGESIAINIKGGRYGDWHKQLEAFSYPFAYDHSQDFVKLNPYEKYAKEGWTKQFAQELANLVSERIHSVNDHQGSFGKDKTEFNDIAASFKLAQKAGPDKLQQVVDLVNKYEASHGRAQVKVEKVAQSNIWFFGHDASTTLKVEGAPQENSIKFYDKYYK